MLSLQNEYLKKAYEEIERLSLDPNARELYEARSKWLSDTISRYNEAEEKGIEKGKTEIAIKMIQANIDFSLISQVTGLSESFLNELKKK